MLDCGLDFFLAQDVGQWRAFVRKILNVRAS
jgi:hypothetical protein